MSWINTRKSAITPFLSTCSRIITYLHLFKYNFRRNHITPDFFIQYPGKTIQLHFSNKKDKRFLFLKVYLLWVWQGSCIWKYTHLSLHTKTTAFTTSCEGLCYYAPLGSCQKWKICYTDHRDRSRTRENASCVSKFF